MRYGITRLVLGCDALIELSGEQFARAKSAKSHLMHALYVEEKLNYVLDNFLEFERQLLDATLNSMLFAGMAWSESVAEIHTVNRRIVNLLTSCRLYLDHVAHHIHAIYGTDSAQSNVLAKAKSDEYDSHLGYRVMEAMRNYVQHRGFPVHQVTRSSGLVDRKPGSPTRHSVIPSIDINALALDRKFKTAVLQELAEVGETVDIQPLIREYIESIGRIHVHVRETLQGDIPAWESAMKEIVTKYHDHGGSDTSGLILVAVGESSKYVEQIAVFDDFMTRREKLERKNSHLTRIASHFVTSAVKDA